MSIHKFKTVSMDHFAHGEHAGNKMESKRPRAENKNMQIKTLLPYATLFVNI